LVIGTFIAISFIYVVYQMNFVPDESKDDYKDESHYTFKI